LGTGISRYRKKTGKKKKYFYNDKNGDKIKADNGNYENKLV